MRETGKVGEYLIVDPAEITLAKVELIRKRGGWYSAVFYDGLNGPYAKAFRTEIAACMNILGYVDRVRAAYWYRCELVVQTVMA